MPSSNSSKKKKATKAKLDKKQRDDAKSMAHLRKIIENRETDIKWKDVAYQMQSDNLHRLKECFSEAVGDFNKVLDALIENRSGIRDLAVQIKGTIANQVKLIANLPTCSSSSSAAGAGAGAGAGVSVPK